MNKILVTLALICSSNGIFSQELSEKRIKEIIEIYKSNFESVVTINECGHVFDGPLFAAKQFENSVLDAAFKFKPKERKEIAQSIHADIKKSHKFLESHPSKVEITTILNKITKQLPSNTITFKLFFIESEQINAFTSMGGYIYLTTGLIDFVDSFDELAFIIGHEVAHEYKLHTQRKISKLVMATNFFGFINATDFKKMALAINSTLSAPFDQIDEYEADKYGAILAKKAGYDANRFGDFFKKLEKYEKRDLLTKLQSTHPFAKHRKECLSNYTK